MKETSRSELAAPKRKKNTGVGAIARKCTRISPNLFTSDPALATVMATLKKEKRRDDTKDSLIK